MCKFGHALPRLYLGDAAAPAFIQKTSNECSLRKEHDGKQHHLPTVLFPGSWLAEENRASRRKTGFADAPALHLPPVELRRCESDGWDLDVARPLAPKDANGYGSGLAAPLEHGEKRAANNLVTEEGLVIRKYRCVGDAMKSCQRRIAFVHNTCRINQHQLPENGRVRRKGGRMFQYVAER